MWALFTSHLNTFNNKKNCLTQYIIYNLFASYQRLFLREFAIEILRSAFNTLVKQVRRTLERVSSGNDDSYLIWAIRFFLEFNRLNGFQLSLVR